MIFVAGNSTIVKSPKLILDITWPTSNNVLPASFNGWGVSGLRLLDNRGPSIGLGALVFPVERESCLRRRFSPSQSAPEEAEFTLSPSTEAGAEELNTGSDFFL